LARTSERAFPSGRPDKSVTGVVLAGGKSSRLGKPKPLVVIGGQLILARIKLALERVCEEIVLVVAADQDDATPDTGIALGMHVVPDRLRGAGPLAGIEMGFRSTQTNLAFLVAADHPFLSSQLISRMVDLAAEESFDAVVPSYMGKLEPLHAVYRVETWLPAITSALEDGRRSVYSLVQNAVESGNPRVKLLQDMELAKLDPKGRSLFDIDTPDSLEIAREMLGTIGLVRPDIRPGGL